MFRGLRTYIVQTELENLSYLRENLIFPLTQRFSPFASYKHLHISVHICIATSRYHFIKSTDDCHGCNSRNRGNAAVEDAIGRHPGSTPLHQHHETSFHESITSARPRPPSESRVRTLISTPDPMDSRLSTGEVKMRRLCATPTFEMHTLKRDGTKHYDKHCQLHGFRLSSCSR
jgi:hypothetical protein